MRRDEGKRMGEEEKVELGEGLWCREGSADKERVVRSSYERRREGKGRRRGEEGR